MYPYQFQLQPHFLLLHELLKASLVDAHHQRLNWFGKGGKWLLQFLRQRREGLSELVVELGESLRSLLVLQTSLLKVDGELLGFFPFFGIDLQKLVVLTAETSALVKGLCRFFFGLHMVPNYYTH